MKMALSWSASRLSRCVLMASCFGCAARSPRTTLAPRPLPRAESPAIPAAPTSLPPHPLSPPEQPLKWPDPPDKLTTLAESRAATPAWWPSRIRGLVPASRDAFWLYDSSTDAQPPREEVAGLACFFSEEAKTSWLTVKTTKETVSVVAGGAAVFVPGIQPALVQQLQASHYSVHQAGLTEILFGVTVPVFLPLVLLNDGATSKGSGTFSPSEQLPWRFKEATCVAAGRTIVEKYLSYALRDFSSCIDKQRALHGLAAEEPELRCVGSVAGLVGWADARTRAILPIFEERIAEVKRERAAAHATFLESRANGEVDLGDRHVTAARLVTQKPTRGAAAEHQVRLGLTNTGPGALAPLHTSWVDKPLRAIDAKGEQYSVRLENISFTSERPGAEFRIVGSLSRALFASEPRGPLLLELPTESPVVTIDRERPAVLNLGDVALEVGVSDVTCATTQPASRRVSGAFTARIQGGGRLPPGYLELVALPDGGHVALFDVDSHHAEGPTTFKVKDQLVSDVVGNRDPCPRTWGVRYKYSARTSWVRVAPQER